jgi:uridine kinase
VTPVIVGIAGGSGSGKSTVARRVAEALSDRPVALLDMDAYYKNMTHLSLEERRQVNWDHPNAFDLELFLSQLARLAAGEAVEKPVYDFTIHARATETVRVGPAEAIVVDGMLLFVDRRVRSLCDIKLFVDADPDVRLVRRIRRDLRVRGRPLEEILEQYLSTVRPMHTTFVEPTKRYADFVLPRGARNEVAIQMIIAAIHQRLGVTAP